jgi:hypothetical protein
MKKLITCIFVLSAFIVLSSCDSDSDPTAIQKIAVILDADITGPSIPKMYGVHEMAIGNEMGMLPCSAPDGTRIMSVNLLLGDHFKVNLRDHFRVNLGDHFKVDGRGQI